MKRQNREGQGWGRLNKGKRRRRARGGGEYQLLFSSNQRERVSSSNGEHRNKNGSKMGRNPKKANRVKQHSDVVVNESECVQRL